MYFINRSEFVKDGKTAYERGKDKVASVLGLEFGVKVLFIQANKWKIMAELRSKWEFVGVRPRSNEIWVATAERIWKVRSVRRLPEDVPWLAVGLCEMGRFQGDRQADGDIPEDKAAEIPPQEMQDYQGTPCLTIATKRQVSREVYINMEGR